MKNENEKRPISNVQYTKYLNWKLDIGNWLLDILEIGHWTLVIGHSRKKCNLKLNCKWKTIKVKENTI